MPRMPTFKQWFPVQTGDPYKPRPIKNAEVKDFLRCAYVVALCRCNAPPKAKRYRYEDERVIIEMDAFRCEMEITWKGPDRRKYGLEGGDNPVVMVTKNWVLIRRHGETNLIQDHIIDLGRIRP